MEGESSLFLFISPTIGIVSADNLMLVKAGVDVEGSLVVQVWAVTQVDAKPGHIKSYLYNTR